MPERFLFIFGALGVLGLAIIILGFKFSAKTRKTIETTGAIIFHVGVFGILYHRVSLNLFISLVALVIALFILIDPLKIANHVNERIYRLFGFVTLFASVAFALDHWSGFPVWLWVIPLVIYLAPYLISSLRKHLKLILALSWVVVFSYVGLIGYVIYARFDPQADLTFVRTVLPQLKITQKVAIKNSDDDTSNISIPLPKKLTKQPQQLQVITQPENDMVSPIPKPTKSTLSKDENEILSTSNTTQIDNTKPKPAETTNPNISLDGPYLSSLRQADRKFINLKRDYDSLKRKYRKLAEENALLKQQIKQNRNATDEETL